LSWNWNKYFILNKNELATIGVPYTISEVSESSTKKSEKEIGINCFSFLFFLTNQKGIDKAKHHLKAHLPDYLAGMYGFIHGFLPSNEIQELKTYLTAYGGYLMIVFYCFYFYKNKHSLLEETLTARTTHVITSQPWDIEFQQLTEKQFALGKQKVFFLLICSY